MHPTRRIASPRGRRRLLAAATVLLAGLALAACGGEASSSDESGRIPIKLAHQSAGSLSFLAIRVAHDKGFFEDEGIDAEVITIGDPGVVGAALQNGSVDVAADDNSVHAANLARGIELRSFAGLYKGMRLQLVVRKGLDVPKMGDPGVTWQDVISAMEGRVIAMPGVAVSGGRVFTQLASEAGLGADDYTLVETAAGAPLVGAIDSGRADAFLHADATTLTAVSSGVGEVALDLVSDIPDYFADLEYTSFAAMESTLEKYPDLPAKWQAATQKAIDLINDPGNAEYLHDVALRTVDNMPPTTDSPELDDTIAKLAPGYIATVDPTNLGTTLDFWREVGTLDTDTTADDLLWQAAN